ncbi:terminase, partial [Salmonella enterica subsp. enterica serovar Kisarawe]|nr:terminase [Salmonella enterica subsp. enterica serovar Kisarawe]
PNAGVKREIATLTRALKKLTGDTGDETDGDDTAPARKPAARKPATGKAKTTGRAARK